MTGPSPKATFGSGTEALSAMEGAERYNAAIEREIAAAVAPAGAKRRLLDIGAGSGEFARRMRRRGHDVVCVEPEPTHRSALQAAGFDCTGSVDEAVGEFDGAYMVNVLEHVDDDVTLVQAIHGRLVPGASFYVWVPAFQALYSDFDYALGHYRRYTKRGLGDVLQQGGFTVQRIGYRDSVGWFAAATWKVVPGRDRVSVSPRSVALYDRWVFPVSAKLDRVASVAFGKNVMAVATKGRPA